jgi:hypothetical protein
MNQHLYRSSKKSSSTSSSSDSHTVLNTLCTISEKRGHHLPCQSTIAAQLFGNGGKIEPYTIIIMTTTTGDKLLSFLSIPHYLHVQIMRNSLTCTLCFGCLIMVQFTTLEATVQCAIRGLMVVNCAYFIHL